MRNQTSFRLTTTLLPTDTTAKTTQVINKVDSSGNKFYPTFTEETVVLTNDDRTVMETTRATCTDGVLTFVKRGLSDDNEATEIENRKLTWNPGSIAFITVGAADLIDIDDNLTRTGNQTYTGNLISNGAATYNGNLTTNGVVDAKKGIQYPSFETLADLQDYATPFGGMFAVVESNGEIYRYNAVTEEWSVVTTESPLNPETATTSRIGTVRGATDAEFIAGTGTGSDSELLIATPSQIKSLLPQLQDLNVVDLGNTYKKDYQFTWSGESSKTDYVEYTTTNSGYILLQRHMKNSSSYNIFSTALTVDNSSTAPCLLYSTEIGTFPSSDVNFNPEILIPVGKGKVRINITYTWSRGSSGSDTFQLSLWFKKFFYFG